MNADAPAPANRAGCAKEEAMGRTVRLTAGDGYTFDAWFAEPPGEARGGLVVAMEMYGVNDYLRGVCDAYARDGYAAIAPDLWARLQPGLIIPYDDEGNRRGLALCAEADWDLALADLAAAADALRDAGKVAITGFCYGGTLAWLAACKGGFDAAVAYYGSDMCDYPELEPNCPVLCHVGDADTAVPPDKVAAFRARRPEVPWHIYPGAKHGFDNPLRPARHHAKAAALARRRTLDFLAREIG
jgi:carboxymethylenebutenolidase